MPRLSSELPGIFHFLADWWRDATGRSPEWAAGMTPGRVLLRRAVLWSPVLAALLLAGGGAAGFYGLMGWRANSLAGKAEASLRNSELPMAFLQVESAAKLRESAPRVMRVRAAVLAAVNDPRCLDLWEQLGAQGRLEPGEVSDWVSAALRLGDEAQFMAAVTAWAEVSGNSAEVPLWQGRRALSRRDFPAAERYLREASSLAGNPAARLELARLLVAMDTPDSHGEAAKIVEDLSTGSGANEALALGISSVRGGPATRLAWARRAYEMKMPGNEALLPAAGVLVDENSRSLEDVAGELEVVFIGATPDERAFYAQWLLSRGLASEVLESITVEEARGSRPLFLVRTEALGAAGDWSEMLRVLDAGSPLGECASLLLRARAESALDRGAAAAASWRKAIMAGAKTLQLPEILTQVDETGNEELADRVLLELCGDFATADAALRVARWRFSQRGHPRLREEALRLAQKAAPGTPVVADMGRLQTLLDGGSVDPTETVEACQAEPSNIDFRLTHALALTRSGRTGEALVAVQPCEGIQHQLTPGQKAVLASVLAASGSREEAMALARTIRSAHLTDGEYRLVYALATARSAVGGVSGGE